MTWGKIDDRFHGHSKARRAGVAIALWTLALSWSCAELTDGHVPDDMPDLLIPGGSEMAATLVRVGLWERAESGYQFHDWAEYQISAKEVRKARDAVSVVRSKAGRKGAAAKWQKSDSPANSHEKSDGKRDGKPMANRWQTDGPIPIPIPKEEISPIPPQGDSKELPSAPTSNESRPSPVASCTTVEHLGQDPFEVAQILGGYVPTLRHFPGGMMTEFREETRRITVDWVLFGEWLAAGGTRRHAKNDVSWRWLLAYGNLGKCWVLCEQWATAGKPLLDTRGIPTAPKPAAIATKAPANIPVVSSSLAYLRDGKRMTPEEFAASSAEHKARIAAKNAAERARLEALEATEASRVSA